MSLVQEPRTLPPGLFRRFVRAAIDETGREQLIQLLTGAGLEADILEEDRFARMGGEQAVELFVRLQDVLRQYYGRGARGMLLRIGRNIWEQAVQGATLLEKTELEILRRLPHPARRRRVVNFVAEMLRSGGGSTTVHLLDTELLLVDRNSASTRGQESTTPVCFITVGLLEAALFWVTGKDADVEEVSCRAAGGAACEFRVRPGA